MQAEARATGNAERPRWPMIILRSPKGWTGPKEFDGHKVEGFWRAHQVPILDVVANPAHLKLLEGWLRSYKPEELFDDTRRADSGVKGAAAGGQSPDQRKSARQWWTSSQAAAIYPTFATMP